MQVPALQFLDQVPPNAEKLGRGPHAHVLRQLHDVPGQRASVTAVALGEVDPVPASHATLTALHSLMAEDHRHGLAADKRRVPNPAVAILTARP